MGIFRMGYLSSFLSDPLISGFTCGAAVHVFSSQVAHLFGVPVPNYHGAFKLIYVSIHVYDSVRHHITFIINKVFTSFAFSDTNTLTKMKEKETRNNYHTFCHAFSAISCS